MNECMNLPIMLEVDLAGDEYSLEVDSGDQDQFPLEIDTPINVKKSGDVTLPPDGSDGDYLAKLHSSEYGAEWVEPASAVEKDNTRLITSAAVYTEIGNINALLATI